MDIQIGDIFIHKECKYIVIRILKTEVLLIRFPTDNTAGTEAYYTKDEVFFTFCFIKNIIDI